MRILKTIHSAAHKNLPFFIGVCLCMYFSYHMVSGERSYARLSQLDVAYKGQEMVLSGLVRERSDLEVTVSMMRPSSLSPDMLEENSRFVLGYQMNDEVSLLGN